MQRNYNHVYSLLIKENEDIVGHIAYSLYKKEKVEYIQKHIDEGTPLTDIELIPFNEISSTDSSIESYRTKADILLQGFIENVLEETIADIEQQAINKQSEILSNIVKPLTPTFLGNVGAGIVSAFIFAILLAVLAFILQFQGTVFNLEVKKPLPTETIEK